MDVAHDAVVHPLSRAAQRPCVRPACPAPARATLSFAYERREAWLDTLADAVDPQAYDLCASHAARTRAPYGWRLRDRRPDDERSVDSPPVTPADLGSERTVAVLAAALRAVPATVPENDGGQPHVVEVSRDDAGDAVDDGGPPEGPATSSATATAVPEDIETRRMSVAALEPELVPVAEFEPSHVDDPAPDELIAHHAERRLEPDGPAFATEW